MTQVDWGALANRAIDTAITVIGNKIQGVKTTAGAGVSVGSSGGSIWASAQVLPLLIIGSVVIGAVLILKGK